MLAVALCGAAQHSHFHWPDGLAGVTPTILICHKFEATTLPQVTLF